RSGPRIERRRLHTFNVVQIQFGDQREIVTDLFAAPRQPAHVLPRRLHAFIRDVAQPSAKYREPVPVSHATTACFFAGPFMATLRSSRFSFAIASASCTAVRSRARYAFSALAASCWRKSASF